MVTRELCGIQRRTAGSGEFFRVKAVRVVDMRGIAIAWGRGVRG